jgi:hypothetical protein
MYAIGFNPNEINRFKPQTVQAAKKRVQAIRLYFTFRHINAISE